MIHAKKGRTLSHTHVRALTRPIGRGHPLINKCTRERARNATHTKHATHNARHTTHDIQHTTDKVGRSHRTHRASGSGAQGARVRVSSNRV